MIQASTMEYLKKLRKNNNKEWFEKHRDAYTAARADFASFVQQVIDLHGKEHKEIANLLAKDCMYRINRDIRFSKDKTPYKTNFGAGINEGGKKAISTAGYYLSIKPGATFVGGGLWMPPSPDLQKVRQEIDYNYDAFQKIVQAPAFRKHFGKLSEDKEYILSRPPKGYEADNPAIEHLKLKSYIAEWQVGDAEVLSKDFAKKVVKAFSALKPLIDFINEARKG